MFQMLYLVNFARRLRQPEIMDQPHLDRESHFHALEGLGRLNRWSGSARILWRPIAALARDCQRPLRVLDIATGGGDVPIGLWSKARRAGLAIELAGCDLSPRAVEYAQRRAAETGAPVRFFQLDALRETIPPGYDVLTCSLFLHHLTEEQSVHLLRRMAGAAGRMLLINDLTRGLVNFFIVALACRLCTRCHVVHVDGPRSVRAAFTLAEARALAERAGLQGAAVKKRHPARFLLVWRKP